MGTKHLKAIISLCLLFFVLQSADAAKYRFRFIYGLGTNKAEKALIFYQLIDKSGNAMEKVPISIEDKGSAIIKFSKRKIKEIRFSGYFLDSDNKKRKKILTTSKQIISLAKGSSNTNIVPITAAEEITDSFTNIADILGELSEKRYVDILNKAPKDGGFQLSNVYPVGKFILYNPKTGISKDVMTFDKEGSFFIESSKSIYDEYLLRKDAGVSVDLKYKRLNSISTANQKQQFIKFVVQIDTLQIIHWQSKVSEMEFLYNRAQEGRMHYLFTELKRNPDTKLFFISSCIRIKDFSLFSQVGDSIGTTQDMNLNVPGNTSNISIKSGIVYSSSEGKTSINKTSIFYTGFGVRDYTFFVRNMLDDINLKEQICDSKRQLDLYGNQIKDLFHDIQKVDSSLIDFDSPEIICRFFENISERQLNQIPDTLNPELKRDLFMKNQNIQFYNAALFALQEKIGFYIDTRNYLGMLEGELFRKNDNNVNMFIPPKEIKVENDVIENALSGN